MDDLIRNLNISLVEMVASAIWEKKGFDVRAYDVRGILDYTDCMVICSGSSDRQANAIADCVIGEVKQKTGEKPVSSEGLRDGRWALIDFSDVVVHVFHQPVRDYYELDRLYADAPQVPLTAPQWAESGDSPWATAGDWSDHTVAVGHDVGHGGAAEIAPEVASEIARDISPEIAEQHGS